MHCIQVVCNIKKCARILSLDTAEIKKLQKNPDLKLAVQDSKISFDSSWCVYDFTVGYRIRSEHAATIVISYYTCCPARDHGSVIR